jgi:SAM-dependent methyltransferase
VAHVPEVHTLEEWCARVPGLARTGAHSWSFSSESSISFPSDAHIALAEIEPRSYWFNHRNDVIAATVRRYPPKGLIFDIGGGNGYVSLGLKKAGFECVVVEPSALATANAAARGLPVIRASFQDLALPDGSISAAGMFDVLEHIEDDLGVLTDIHRVLKPDGYLYIAVPSYGLLWSEEDAQSGHFRRYALSGLKGLLEKAGFIVDYGTYFFAILVVPVFLMRTLPSRLGLTLSAEVDKDHTLPSGAIGSVIQRSFRRELAKIAAGGTLKIGASCLVVARKP